MQKIKLPELVSGEFACKCILLLPSKYSDVTIL